MGYTFHPFFDRLSSKESVNRFGNFDISNTNVADTTLASTTLSTENEKSPLLLPKSHNLLIGANPESHYLIEERKLQLLATTFYRKNYL